MAYKIDEIEGIGPVYREKLRAAGINNTDDLLDQCCTPKGRKATAETTGVSEKMLLEWSNMADLMRVSGVGRQFAELLEASGVDTIKELRQRNAENLATKMGEVNEEKKLSKSTPNVDMIKDWIAQAEKTDPKIEY
jgi:predicted flap endonuclease-1-like 5' DNA nuclease